MVWGFGGFEVFALFLCSMRYLSSKKRREFPEGKYTQEANQLCNGYSSFDLQHATSNFHPDNELGRGEHGEVFKGVLEDGTEVAIKRLVTNSTKGAHEFLETVKLFTNIKHQNLVKLKGWCLEGSLKLLVYEYLEQRSLAQALLDEKTKVEMSWPVRFNIAVGISRGLAYLHEHRPPIIHGDIKASNVLLDKSFNPKIGDFVLSNLFLDKALSPCVSCTAENLGYLAPEYVLNGQLTKQVDTYSFGVIVLELISGRSNVEQNFQHNQRFLLEWAWKLYKEGQLEDLVDPKLKRDYSEDEVFRLIHVALLCTQSSSATRPSMSQVIAMINGDDEITVFPSPPGIVPQVLEQPKTSSTSPR